MIGEVLTVPEITKRIRELSRHDLMGRVGMIAETLHRTLIQGFDQGQEPEVALENIQGALRILRVNGLPNRVCDISEITMLFLQALSKNQPDKIAEMKKPLRDLLQELPSHQAHLRAWLNISPEIIALAPAF